MEAVVWNAGDVFNLMAFYIWASVDTNASADFVWAIKSIQVVAFDFNLSISDLRI
jgi:hypothetical protein